MSSAIVETGHVGSGTGVAVISPVKLAHFVLRTSRFKEMVAWYKAALGARAVFENELLAFLTYDKEHHRVAPGRRHCLSGA